MIKKLALAFTASGFMVASIQDEASAQYFTANQTPPLNTYYIDPAQISVSGISSGGYMAQQFHIAHSAKIMGVGIIAGGPYHCAWGATDQPLSGNAYQEKVNHGMRVCSDTATFRLEGDACPTPSTFQTPPSPQEITTLINFTQTKSGSREVDDIGNISGDKIYIFTGTCDRVVPSSIVETLKSYYLGLRKGNRAVVAPGDLQYVSCLAAAHAMPTDNATLEHQCGYFGSPYVNHCEDATNCAQADTAKHILEHIYGSLAARSSGEERAARFDQAAFIVDPQKYSLDSVGHIYVPAAPACRDDAHKCKLHVAFHGCGQNDDQIGDVFYNQAGYNAWAATNNIIVLYPQQQKMTVPSDLYAGNPQGCWDFWGYTGKDFAFKTGQQIAAVDAMINHVAGLMGPPAAVRVKKSDSEATLSWLPLTSKDLAGYNVYRSTTTPVAIDNAHRVADRITTPNFTDTSLQSGRTYYYAVTALDRTGKETDYRFDVSTADGNGGCCHLRDVPTAPPICNATACQVLCNLGQASCN